MFSICSDKMSVKASAFILDSGATDWEQVSHPSIKSLMHQQSLREPLELFEACADLNASGRE